MKKEAVEQAILELEKRRVAALIAGDIGALDALITPDLVHIHGSGQIDDKQAYLHGVESKYRFHRVERGDLNVRVYGDVAVVTGPLSQTVSISGEEKLHEVSALTTQVWARSGADWKQNTCHVQILSVA